MSFYGRRPKAPEEAPAVAVNEEAPPSIYRRRAATNVAAGKGEPAAAATAVAPPAPLARPVGVDVARLRKTNPVNVILPLSRKWLDGLPPDVRPVRLAEKYPRLVNLIALEWHTPAAFAKLMDELLTDHRGGRKGFAVEILHELSALRAHYYREPSVY
jgi:hypothetical protein